MTDRELAEQAEAYFKKTTDSYPAWVRKGRPATNWKKGFDVLDQIGAPPPQPPAPTPPPAPVGGVLELSGTYTTATFQAAVQSAGSGALTVRPKQGATVTVNGRLFVRDDITYQGITFDGGYVENQNYCANWHRWKLLGCTFKRYFILNPPNPSDPPHSEALYIGGGASDGLVDGCTFDDNGNTAHIFFTWFGGSPDAYDQSNYPKRICVRNSTFKNGRNPWYAVQWRDEIPSSAPIYVDASNTFVGPGPQRPARSCA